MFHSRVCLVAAALAGLVWLGGCRHAAHMQSYLDLIHLMPAAEKRSALPPSVAFQLMDANVGGEIKPGIRACGASRIIWTVWLPDNPVLRTAIAVDRGDDDGLDPIAFRIGIGARRYEPLFRTEFPKGASGARWQLVSISLAAYHGWQWSVFYRPSSTTWPIIFSIDTATSADGRATCGYWAEPRIQSEM